MERSDIEAWVERYIAAWASDDPEDVGELFTESALYAPSPWSTPWEGRDAIVKEWIDRGDSGTEWGFTWDVIALDGDLGIVQGETSYTDPAHIYRNLWLIRLAEDGRAREFTEWWMESPETRKKT